MMKFSISGIRRIDEEIWMNVLATENGIITLVEKIVNAQFEEIMKSSGLSALTSYLTLGGIQVQMDELDHVDDWILTMYENIVSYLTTEAAQPEIPSLEELYTIFAQGVKLNIGRVFDSTSRMTFSTVSGLAMTATRSRIGTFNNQGNLIPHLMTLGNSGDLEISPSLTLTNIINLDYLSPTYTRAISDVHTGM